MEIFQGGCSSSWVNLIGRLDCRDRADFDKTYCPKSKGEGFSIDECNRHCLEIASCAIYQRNWGACWFYRQSDPVGPNDSAAQGWNCGVKKSPGCSVPKGIKLTLIEEALGKSKLNISFISIIHTIFQNFELDACHADYFRCRNRRCVKRSRVCDGFNDCLDNSDEIDGCTGYLTYE